MRFLASLFLLVCLLAIAYMSPALGLLLFFVGVLISPFSYVCFAVNPALPSNVSDAPSGETVDFGTQDTTIPTAAAGASPQVFVVESQTMAFPFVWQVQKTGGARPAKQLGIPDVPTASLDLMLPSGTVNHPYPGAEFTLRARNSVTYTFIVDSPEITAKNDGTPSKITIKARWKLN